MREIRLDCAATHCLDCNSILFQHRVGCSSCLSTSSSSFFKSNFKHGFIIESDRSALHFEDFISSDELFYHIKNYTAKVTYKGKEVTKDQIA